MDSKRIRNKRFLITYPHFYNKTQLINLIEQRYKKKFKCIKVFHNIEHQTVLLIWTFELLNLRKPKLFWIEATNELNREYSNIKDTVVPKIETISTNKEWDKVIQKLDELDDSDLEDYTSIKLNKLTQQDLKEIDEVIKSTPPSTIFPLITVKFNLWQDRLIQRITCIEPETRHISWYYDSTNHPDKIEFFKYIINHNLSLVINQISLEKDIIGTMKRAKETFWNGKCIMLNLNNSATDLYETIKMFKDGFVYDDKHTIIFPIPHLIVFANYLPIVKRFGLYKLRVFEITKNSDLMMVDGYPI